MQRDEPVNIPRTAGPVSAVTDASMAELDPALADLLDELTHRIQTGESVDPELVAAEHPALADSIRRLLPALISVARAGKVVADAFLPGQPGPDGKRRFGEFSIDREIGRGGMGVVYEARQLPIGRRVALKVLPPAAALDPRALKRFQLEAQVAGLLQHPGIVPVYAVGTLGGVPYYAMQYVEGQSLADLVAELRALSAGMDDLAAEGLIESPGALASGLLSGRFAPPRAESGDHSGRNHQAVGVSEVVRAPARPTVRNRAYLRTVAGLGVQAAEALAYAHDQGVVHRDVKPANLLLDDRGCLWVADFGMADVQGDAGLTLTGDLPGTLRYMSPEQALGKRSLVDRRTDVYALGATLYELLTLHPAVSGSDKQEVLRRLAEEEPTPVRRLNPAVPVDLATIVSKCLSKDPSARYETARQLADDLTRFLDGRPIAARPVGPPARLWRWCRRKPALAGLVAALAAAVALGFAGITLNWREAVRQRAEAERQKVRLVFAERQARVQAERADAINHFLTEKLLLQAAPEHNPKARAVTLREALDRAAGEVGPTFRGHPGTEAAVRLAVGQTYHELGEFARSETHLRRAHELFDPDSPDGLRAAIELGHILYHLDRLDEAEALLRRATAESRAALGPSDDTALMSSRYLAILELQRGHLDDAERLLRRGLDDARRGGRPRCLEALNAMTDLGKLLAGRRRHDEAERLLRDVIGLKREALGLDHPDTLTNQHILATVLLGQRRLDEAETLARATLEARTRVVGRGHPYTLLSLDLLGCVLLARGQLDEAETLLRECAHAQRQALGESHTDTVKTAAHLAEVRDARAAAR
jgi:serine/threonine protein kinase